jgi:hypothetical protein
LYTTARVRKSKNIVVRPVVTARAGTGDNGVEIIMKRREFLTKMGTAATLSAFVAGFVVGKVYLQHQDQLTLQQQNLPQSALQALRVERARLRPSG